METLFSILMNFKNDSDENIVDIGTETSKKSYVCIGENIINGKEKIEYEKYFLDDYKIIEIIGQGRCGTIMKAIRKEDSKIIAIKFISKANNSYIKEPTSKYELLSRLNHPNILKVYNYGEDNTNHYWVTPYYEKGYLNNVLGERNVTINEKFHIFDQLLDSVEYLHNNDIMHRNITMENILVTDEKTIGIVLANLGLWKRQGNIDKDFKTRTGTIYYSAPEILTERPSYRGRPADVWSIGIIFYEMLTGLLFKENENKSYQLISNDDCMELITKILQKDPKKRITIKEIRNSIYYQNLKRIV